MLGRTAVRGPLTGGASNMVNFHFSIFNQEVEADAGEPGLVGAAAEVIRVTGQSDRWSLTTDGFWCSVNPPERVRPGQLRRGQGWKIHLSATPASAGKVLAQSLPVLLDGSCPFKFARTLHHVSQLNDRHTPRDIPGNSSPSIQTMTRKPYGLLRSCTR